MEAERLRGEDGPHFAHEGEPDDVRAWEEIDTGRYMPRRIRGSCHGRELG